MNTVIRWLRHTLPSPGPAALAIAGSATGEFTGYMNWDEGLLYSADASKLAHDRCPRCGSEITLAGKGVAQCAHCGSEIFLG